MSMNFAREQSLLRQKLQAKASPDIAAVLQQQHGGNATFLGADHAAVQQAANDLAAAWPAMGRAQMTAFVRTLWNSRIHELRAVGVQLLAARASLLEPADLPLLEGFLKDDAVEAVHSQLAGTVVGTIVSRNKKVWKDLKRFAGSDHDGLRRAAVRASSLPLAADAEAFPRFAELATPLLGLADALLQAAIDEVLVAAAPTHGDAVRSFASEHGRQVSLPKAAPVRPAAPPTEPLPAAKAAPAKAAMVPTRPAATGKAKAPAVKTKPASGAPAKSARQPAAAKSARKPTAKGRAR